MRVIGFLQPFRDAIKLFSKEYTTLYIINFIIYFISPVIAFLVSLGVWLRLPFIFNILRFNLRFLFLLSCLRLGVYSIILAGWASNSNYALLGSIRSIAQTISYEVCLIFIFLSYLLLINRLCLVSFVSFQKLNFFCFINLPIRLVIFVIFLAETNRRPFDFAEGERELVSGFNVEYRRGSFAIIFLAEYTRILFIRILFSLILLGGRILRWEFFSRVLLISFLFIWVRARFPRYRYDLLIYLTWKKYLPISICFFLFFLPLLIIINIL